MNGRPVPENSLRAVVKRAVTPGQYHTEREFLPAALEVVETPPSPTGRRWAF